MNENDIKTGFASAVKFCRLKLGLSQETLAERANLHRTYISDVERGTRNLSLQSIGRLAAALDISIPALFSITGSQSATPTHDNYARGGREFVDVLLVEDSANDVEIALHAFKESRFVNFIQVVRDGEEALDFLFCQGKYSQRRKKTNPQVILLDLNLPKLSGLDVLRRIKMDRRTRNIPVVVLTASQKNRDVDECRRLGVETYLVKPLDFHGLTRVTPMLNLDWGLFGSTSNSHDPSGRPEAPA